MIRSYDIGLSTTGWADLSDLGQVLEFGSLLLPGIPHQPVVEGYTRRIRLQADARSGQDLQRFRAVVAESPAFHGPGRAAVCLALAWGALVTRCHLAGVPLFAVPARVWQHALMGMHSGKVDQDVLADRIADHVRVTGAPRAREQLGTLTAGQRPHALDAAGIGTFWATIGEGRIR